MPLQILVVSPEFGYGGMGLHTMKIARFLLDEGFKVRVHTTKKSKGITRLHHLDLQIIALTRPFPYFDKFNPFFDLISKLDLNRIKPHLIIRPLPQFYFHVPYLNKEKTHELVIVHETFADMIRAIRFSKEKRPIERLLCSRLGRAFIKAEKNILRKSERIIAVSEYTKKTLVDLYGIDVKKVEVIYNPINTSKFKKRSSVMITSRIGSEVKKFKDSSQLAIFIGRPQGVKNPGLFFDLVASHFDDVDLKFVVVGIDANDKHLKHYIENIKHSNVLFCGYVQNDLMPDLYSLADFIIITSISENLSTCLLEAMACGVIPISTNVGGISEVIEDKKNGFLVHSNRKGDFIKVIHQLVNGEYSLKAISRNAQKTVREKFDEKVVKKRYIETMIKITDI